MAALFIVGDVVATPLLTDAGKKDGEPNDTGGEENPAPALAPPAAFCLAPFLGWCFCCGQPAPLVAGLYVNADRERLLLDDMLTVPAMHWGGRIATLEQCSIRACRSSLASGVDTTTSCEMVQLNHDDGGGLDGGGTGVPRWRLRILRISYTVGRGRSPSGVTGAAAPFSLAGPSEEVSGENSAGIGIGTAAAAWDDDGNCR